MLEGAVKDLAPISGKLAQYVRLLSSNQDGEVVAAARAIVRTLKKSGADIHTLADRIEHANGGKLSEAEMKKLYDAGYDAGVRAAENKQHGAVDFHNVDGTPAWNEIALFCQHQQDRLRTNELQFVNDMAERTVWREPTERQGKWLRSIFYRLGGRL
jgi:hypothetical protein